MVTKLKADARGVSMSRNVSSDPSAPRLGVSQLLSIRQWFPEPVLWVCIHCKWSEFSHMQVRCPNGDCNRLMRRAQ